MADPEFHKAIIPRFERTRVVSLVHGSEGKYYLTCTCCHYLRFGIACRHEFCVSNELPKSADVPIRWHQVYARNYDRGNKQLDELIDIALDNENPGLQAKQPSVFRPDLKVGTCAEDSAFFERSLPTGPPVLHPGTHWGWSSPNVLPANCRQMLSCNSAVPETVLHGGLLQTVMLSQAAQDESALYEARAHEGDDEESDDDVEHDDDVFIIDNPDSSEEQGESGTSNGCSIESMREAFRQQQTPYSLLLPLFQEMCVQIQSPEQCIYGRDAIGKLISEFMKMNRSNGPSIIREGSLVTYPAVDRRKRSKRIPTGGLSPKRKAIKK